MLTILSILPKNLISRLFGILAKIYLPVFIRPLFLAKFAQMYRINLNEAELELRAYPSLNAFFTRKLRPGSRVIGSRKNSLISPVDGKIDAHGKIQKNILIQAKGKDYTLEELLKDEIQAKFFLDGYYITIYLSPQDYHRVHAPISGKIPHYTYIPGNLWPVNEGAVLNIKRLFAVNERVITFQDYESKPGSKKNKPMRVATIMVGAFNVGRLALSYTNFKANSWWRKGILKGMANGESMLKKGDELGTFELGSTVILLMPKGSFTPSHPKSGSKIKMGDELGNMP